MANNKNDNDKRLDKFVGAMLSKKYTILLAKDQDEPREAFIKELEDDEPKDAMFQMWRIIFEDDADTIARLDKLEAELDADDSFESYEDNPSHANLMSIAEYAAKQIKKLVTDVTPIWKERYRRVCEFDMMLEMELAHGQTRH